MSVTESDSEWDPKWEHCKTNQFLTYKRSHGVAVKIKRARRRHAKNAGANREKTNTKAGAVVDKGAEDPPCTRLGLKRKMPDMENSDAYVNKNRVSCGQWSGNGNVSYTVHTDRNRCWDGTS